MAEQFTPEIMTELRKDIVRVPEIILEASGIKIFGKLIRSIIFTTDIAIIRNTNANAVIAVYPFTPHPAITKSIIEAADIPVFSGVGGGLTQGARSSYMSMFAEAQGSLGVVLNGPTPLETVKEVCRVVDIPVISTVTSKYTEIDEKLAAGISIINISAGKETAEAVRHFRKNILNFLSLRQVVQRKKVLLRPFKQEQMPSHIRHQVAESFLVVKWKNIGKLRKRIMNNR